MAVLRGAWKYVKVICGNHEDEEVLMEIQEGPHSLFYACPKYREENRNKGESLCLNRINLIEYENMLSTFAELMVDAEENGQVVNLKNYTWERKGIQYRIISHTDEELVVKVLNRRTLRC